MSILLMKKSRKLAPTSDATAATVQLMTGADKNALKGCQFVLVHAGRRYQVVVDEQGKSSITTK